MIVFAHGRILPEIGPRPLGLEMGLRFGYSVRLRIFSPLAPANDTLPAAVIWQKKAKPEPKGEAPLVRRARTGPERSEETPASEKYINS
jgi:hypothetical protein